MKKADLIATLTQESIEFSPTATITQLRNLLERARLDNQELIIAANEVNNLVDGENGAVGGEVLLEENCHIDPDGDAELSLMLQCLEKKKKILLLQKEIEELSSSNHEQRISISDIEGLVPQFSGDDSYPVEKWLTDFASATDTKKCDAHFKYVCMRRLLKGTAAIFLRTSNASNFSE